MNDPSHHHRRRWFQISLRAIFLLMLVIAAYLAGMRTSLRQAEQAERAQEQEHDARLRAERALADARAAQAQQEADDAWLRAQRALADAHAQAGPEVEDIVSTVRRTQAEMAALAERSREMLNELRKQQQLLKDGDEPLPAPSSRDKLLKFETQEHANGRPNRQMDRSAPGER